MQYRIESIEPGEREGDVLVTVAYWYRDNIVGRADFIEEHLIRDLPGVVSVPKRNYLGQYYSKVTGELAAPWVLDETGEWAPLQPNPEEYVFEEFDHTVEQIMVPIEKRAEVVNQERPRGQDRFAPSKRPTPRPIPPQAIRLAKKPEVLSLVGTAKSI